MVVALAGLDNLTAYTIAQQNVDRDLAQIRKDPLVQREIDHFEKKLAEAEDPEAFLDDPRIITFLTKAIGMRDQAANIGLVQKGFLSDPEDPESLANQLVDTRYKDAAGVFQFAGTGLETLRGDTVRNTIIDGYVQDERELSLAEFNPAVPDAIAFKDAVKDGRVESVFSLLGDPIMRRVVLTALQLPVEIAFQSVEAQGRAVEDRLDIEKLEDDKFLDSFVERFLILDSRSGTSTNSDWRLGLFGGSPSGFLIPGGAGILV